MGVIQSGVNQLFSTLGAFTMMSPELRMKREEAVKAKGIEREQEKTTEKARLEAQPALAEDATLKDIAEGMVNVDTRVREQADLAKQKYDLMPSEETYNEYKASQDLVDKSTKTLDEAYSKGMEELTRRWEAGEISDADYLPLAQKFYKQYTGKDLMAEAKAYNRDQVMAKTAKKGKEQIKQTKQRRTFIDFLKTGQLEGTEGLGDAALTQIASQYSKNAKTDLMNQYKYKTGGKK